MWKKKWIENGCVSFAFKYITRFLQHVGPLAIGVFGCYSVLNKLPLIFLKQKYKIKTVKVVLELFKLAKQSCFMLEKLIFADTDVCSSNLGQVWCHLRT